jgi:GNAT superfamily N-acetyltransferase
MKLPHPRPYADSDHAGVLELIAGVYADYGFELDLDDIDKHLNDPAGYFRASGGEFWVVWVDGTVRATVAALVSPEHVELKSLYVHPDFRRSGWGASLSERVEEFARAANKRRVVLWSDVRFDDAHRLYRRLGYVQGGERHFDDANETSEYEFRKDLAERGV